MSLTGKPTIQMERFLGLQMMTTLENKPLLPFVQQTCKF